MQPEVAQPVPDFPTRPANRQTDDAPSLSSPLLLETVFEIAKILTAAKDPVTAMPAVFGTLSAFLDLRNGTLALMCEPVDAKIGERQVNPFVIAATARGTLPDDPTAYSAPEKVISMVFRTGVPLVSLDVAAEFGPTSVPKELRDQRPALIAVPIRAETDLPFVIGVLSVFHVPDMNSANAVDSGLRVMTMTASLLEQSLRFRKSVARDRERIFREAGNAIKALQDHREDPEDAQPVEGIIGSSKAVNAVTKRIRKVAKTSAAVLLRGESGTGKELFARAIHSLSERAKKPFIKVNCAALSETLLETELFGHEKGSFTGATGQKKGRFELADGGTLFLDEIGEIGPSFQSKLLRVLQEGEFERVGGTKTLKVDVRLITATNKDLERAVAKGEFRADLYFRICVVPIHLPPLRERAEDIPDLAATFLKRFNSENGTTLIFADNALDTLVGCAFPGNVRELENCVSRTAALCEGKVIRATDIACHQDACLSAELWRMTNSVSSPIGSLSAGEVIFGASAPAPRAPINPPRAPSRKTSDAERDDLVRAMEQAGWVQAKAARLLGLTPRQIGYALRKHNIEIKKI